jgi:diguanylate cyclase (GGDEF)-like protein/PAS domain S-box-containing protein
MDKNHSIADPFSTRKNKIHVPDGNRMPRKTSAKRSGNRQVAPVQPRRRNPARSQKAPALLLTTQKTKTKATAKTPTGDLNLLQILLDTTPDHIYFKDSQSRFILNSRAQANRFGVKDPSGLVGKTDFDFFPKDQAEIKFADEQRIIATGEPLVGIEEQLTWPDGTQDWVSATKLPLRDPDGNIIGTFGVSRDITARKRAEAADRAAAILRAHNTELENANAVLQSEIAERRRVEEALAFEQGLLTTLMHNLPDAIYFKDRQSRFIRTNHALAKHFGMADPAQAIGKTDFNFFSQEHAQQAFEDEQRIIATGQPIVCVEEKETWPDGRENWVSTTKMPIFDHDRQIIGTFGVSRDITERKTMELSLRHANEELETANATLQEEVAERKRVQEMLDRERHILRELIDNLPDYIFAKDAEGRLTLGNLALAHHLGVNKPEELYGKTDLDFYPVELAKRFHAEEMALMQSGKTMMEFEEDTRDEHGHPQLTLTTKVILFDNRGQAIGLVGNSRDITERKRMELALEDVNLKLGEWVKELERRNREISLLNEMGELLQACRTNEEAYSVVSRQLGLLFPDRNGALGLLNASGNRIITKARWGEGSNYPDSFPATDCWAMRRGKLHIVDTGHSSPLCPHLADSQQAGQSSLCLPLTAQGETQGVLILRSLPDGEGTNPFPENQQQLALTAADHIALALANLNLRETLRAQSIRDALTGLFNRRYLEESLPREISRARRKGTSLGVIMLDLDFFKHFNDAFGHDAGDALLHALGRWLQSNVRAEDIVCRYGGEEFVLILPEVAQDIILQRAQFLCDGVRSLTVEHHGTVMGTISASLGVALFPQHGDSRDELIQAADEAMYRAKREGRDRIVVAETASK